MNGDPNRLSWEEYRYHLTAELIRMSDILDEMNTKVDAIGQQQSIAEARTKWHGSAFGFAAGVLPVTIKVIWDAMFHK